MTMKHAVVIGVVAGLSAALVLVLLSLAAYLMVGGASRHVVEFGRDGEPAYTVP